MQPNRNLLVLIIIGAIIVAASVFYLKTPPNTEIQDSDEDTQKPESEPESKTETEPESEFEPEHTPTSLKSTVEIIVQEYLRELGAQISQVAKEDIETTVMDYPVKLRPASEAITLIVEEGEEINITLDIKTRDWAYAALGLENTLTGGLVDGQENKLDYGFYCFLQAAALNLDEPEHLSNLAFHLNNNGDYKNAEILLQYALTLDENYYPALSNLAYAYAGQGDIKKAILQQLKVVSLRPEKLHYLRLADYYEKAGFTEASEAVKNAVEGDQEEITISTPHTLTLSSNARDILYEIDALEFNMSRKFKEIHDNKFQVICDKLGKLNNDTITPLWEWAFFECPMDLPEGGDVCTQCYNPATEEAFNLISALISGQSPALIHAFESEAFKELENYTRQAIEIVEEADLDESERETLLNEIYRRFTVEQAIHIMYYRSIWRSECDDLLFPYLLMFIGFQCEESPIENFELKELNPDIDPIFGKKWTIWFVIGSISNDPEGNFEISLGQIFSGSWRYNYARGVSSVGVGVGLNLGKVWKLGVSMYFNPTDGVQPELSGGLSSPIPMYIPDVPFSITSKPRIGSLMN